jgi:hypothetical protein
MSGARANAAAIQRRVNKSSSNSVQQHAIPDNSQINSGKTNISVSKAISILQKSIIDLQDKYSSNEEADNDSINEEIQVLNDKLSTINSNILILKKENNELKEIVKGLQQLTNTMNSKILSMS